MRHSLTIQLRVPVLMSVLKCIVLHAYPKGWFRLLRQISLRDKWIDTPGFTAMGFGVRVERRLGEKRRPWPRGVVAQVQRLSVSSGVGRVSLSRNACGGFSTT